MAGLYVHIPFCKSRCVYCGFYSTSLFSMSRRYVDALIQELRRRVSDYDGAWRTVYLGGGTPSTLAADELGRLFSAIDCSSAREVTIECNPDDVTADFVRQLSALPVNRVSMGAQTFDDDRLRFLRRRHKAADVAQAVARLRDAGIANISVDLMYGFPGETLADWNHDIDEALALDVEHISAYCLTYEESTPLYDMLLRGEVSEASEELTREMYYGLIARLSALGYEHYEVSNFSRRGGRSLHNSGYWTGEPYLGIGAAAHSYDGMRRLWNISDLPIYINKVERGECAYESESLTERELYNDMVMLALRTSEGIDLKKLGERFGSDAVDYCLKSARRYVDSSLLEHDANTLRLAHDGWYVSDMIISDLMKV